MPATNHSHDPAQAHAATAAMAVKIAAFEDMEPIPLPVTTAFVQAMDLLRISSSLRQDGGQVRGMSVRLPAGTGKTTAVRMLMSSVASRVGGREDAVLYVELDVEESIPLWSSILKALRDPYWNVGYPKNLKERALKFLAKRGIELIVIDEFNHAEDRGQAKYLMNTVKQLLNAGPVPVVCLGTDAELDRLPKAPGFERRMVHAPALAPLDWNNPEHERSWRGLLQGFDHAIESKRLLQNRSGLGARKLAKELFDACGGVFGYAQWVVQDSLTEVLRRGGGSIETIDLATSVDRLFVKFEIHDRINGVGDGA